MDHDEKHYLDACEGYVPAEDGLPKLIRNLWPECERVREFGQGTDTSLPARRAKASSLLADAGPR